MHRARITGGRIELKCAASSLEGNTGRAIDFHEGDKIDEKALKALIRRRRGTEHVLRSDKQRVQPA